MRIFIYGGAGSGKSELAEKYATNFEGTSLVYAALLDPNSGGDTQERIKKHKKTRNGKGFFTVQSESESADNFIEDIYTQISDFAKKNQKDLTILIEDLGNLTSRILFSKDGNFLKGEEGFVKSMEFLQKINALSKNLVVVSNDIFLDGAGFSTSLLSDEGTLSYYKTLAKLNSTLAHSFEKSIRVVAGIEVNFRTMNQD
ncbi:bifunctional adenosylcobinamide kinase/adenosylcobinamide-phosphate guanylyltransferase [Treponema zioleckii]|uniref:bifunctional adenosylcobinamide kinase/adenosylcobinamide-phosphate guanylyltransferase n=1 Tax=Treponema zioleckii TaxID=331680 RepID=UPI00168A5371|nr:bifunctional adenosylcobinamide kinase/adenosylcobinamide-phosphate guanylyltransferase [Treponema zioleckii]